MEPEKQLSVLALELCQGTTRKLYSFAVDGKMLRRFAAISRVHENDEDDVAGYQRPEVLAHIADIREYLDSEDPMLPTSLVVAFDDSVTFVPVEVKSDEFETGRCGILRIPLSDESGNPRQVAWIVDGQQRAAAIRDAGVSSFPVFVTGFIAESDKDQREQFILVNSPKPLPKDLIYELLPGTETRLPGLLQRRRFSATLLRRLNKDDNSPFREMVRTPTNPKGVIKDNSILRMIENSLSDGALYAYKTAGSPEADPEGMLILLKNYWEATATVFHDAWGQPPKRSRLMHGAGIIGMGLVMDALAEGSQPGEEPTVEEFRVRLEPLREACHWTEGHWDFLHGRTRNWNEIQNTSKDIQMLAMHLLREYHERVVEHP